jgi:hypothetical protein
MDLDDLLGLMSNKRAAAVCFRESLSLLHTY